MPAVKKALAAKTVEARAEDGAAPSHLPLNIETQL